MLINNFIKKEGRALPVFILLDVSGSMSGEKIETVNIALKEINIKTSGIAPKVCLILIILYRDVDSA